MENRIRKLKVELPYDSVVLIYIHKNWKQDLREYLYSHVQNGIIHNSWKMEAAHPNVHYKKTR